MEDKKAYMRKSVLLWCILMVISIILGYSIYNAFSGRIYANVVEFMNNNLRFAEKMGKPQAICRRMVCGWKGREHHFFCWQDKKFTD